MANSYSPDEVPLHEARLGKGEFAAIGRLVRACADIEDLVTLYIAKLMGVKEGMVVVALGTTPFSKRLSIAGYLAKVHGSREEALFKTCFHSDFSDLTTCRNAVAHGTLLGQSKDGRWAFLTPKTENPEAPGSTVQVVISYRKRDIELHADGAEMGVSIIEQTLGLQPLRDTRRGRPLLPHRKAQKSGTPGKRRQPPP